MNLTMTEWDALSEYDRSWALGAVVAEAEEAALRCPECGGPASECQDPDNQHAFVVSTRRCFRTRAEQEAKQARAKQGGDFAGVIFSVTLDPTLKKSARGVRARG